MRHSWLCWQDTASEHTVTKFCVQGTLESLSSPAPPTGVISRGDFTINLTMASTLAQLETTVYCKVCHVGVPSCTGHTVSACKAQWLDVHLSIDQNACRRSAFELGTARGVPALFHLLSCISWCTSKTGM